MSDPWKPLGSRSQDDLDDQVAAARALADEHAEWRQARGLQPSRDFLARVGRYVVQVRAGDFPALALVVLAE